VIDSIVPILGNGGIGKPKTTTIVVYACIDVPGAVTSSSIPHNGMVKFSFPCATQIDAGPIPRRWSGRRAIIVRIPSILIILKRSENYRLPNLPTSNQLPHYIEAPTPELHHYPRL
jgi:hypothetical protein